VSDVEKERTYSIWPFLLLFVVLGFGGLFGFLILGNPTTPTDTIPPFTSAPTTSTTEAPDDTTPVTAPGGAAVPERVRDVVVDGDSTSYAFEVPETLATAPLRAVVARAQAVPDAAGTSLVVDVACTASADEALAQITVTETAESVTVLPVAVMGADATAPCAPDAAPRQVVLPLRAALGGRGVVLVPAGTPVPAPTP
jgi:hypothetical protein